MHIVLNDGQVYDDAADIAHRLEREDLVERVSYETTLDHHFDLCPWCEDAPDPALLDWYWPGGSAQCCINMPCAHAVLHHIEEQQVDPENITVEHPVFVIPNISAQAA